MNDQAIGKQLHDGEVLAYLATPYTKFEDGIEAAFEAAARLAAQLMLAGIRLYSPIVHCHPIARFGRIDPLNVQFWLDNQAVMMRVCQALIVAELQGWDCSTGIAHELKTFGLAGKPIFHCNPETLLLRRVHRRLPGQQAD